MDILSYKQTKTVWRLIAFRCDIQTVISIFKTCKENRELSTEESLWRQLCRRHFRHGDTKEDYVCKYTFGSHVLFDHYVYEGKVDITRNQPMYFFANKHHWLVTIKPQKRYRLSTPVPLTPNMEKYEITYTFHPETKTVTSYEPITTSINVKRMIDWILEHFATEEVIFRQNYIEFQGKLLPGFYSLVTWNETALKYYLYYLGSLEVSTPDIYMTRILAEIHDKNGAVTIPKFTLPA